MLCDVKLTMPQHFSLDMYICTYMHTHIIIYMYIYVYIYTCTSVCKCATCMQDSDLRSAVCLEQAAHAFLRINPAMARKYALHLVLAGHRYAKSGQVQYDRVHTLLI